MTRGNGHVNADERKKRKCHGILRYDKIGVWQQAHRSITFREYPSVSAKYHRLHKHTIQLHSMNIQVFPPSILGYTSTSFNLQGDTPLNTNKG